MAHLTRRLDGTPYVTEEVSAAWGDEAQVAEALMGLFALEATEVLVSPVPVGADRATSLERTMRLLCQVAQAV